MALPSKYRWIILGNLVIRNHKNAPDEAPYFTLLEVVEVIKTRITEEIEHQEFSKNKSRLMWLSHVGEDDKYYKFLAHTGDKNMAAPSFVNFKTRESRDVKKEDHEGGQYSAHILIKKEANANGNYLILVERVPSLHLSALKNHFGWICRADRFKKEYKDKDNQDKTCSPVFEIDGYQSNTIREALKTGKLQDVEFIRHEESFEDGLDEDSIVEEVIHQAKWDIKRKVSDEEASTLFGKIPAFFKTFKGASEQAELFVRIKTGAGQIKRAKVDVEGDGILEQAFVQNEMVGDFDTKLEQRHDNLREDMITKMQEIARDKVS